MGIRAILREGSHNVEVNNNSSYQTRDRNIDYGFRLYSSNANRGSSDDYGTTIQINLDNYAFVGNENSRYIYFKKCSKEQLINILNKLLKNNHKARTN